ncbi:MAG: YkgJ family cysteine cluster protein [Promethearchaeota archaeon]
MKEKCENCGQCCIRTEMILSKQDIKRIKKNAPKNLVRKKFIFKNDEGFFQLKNLEEHCIFLDFQSKKCKIYDIRPKGCIFYPLIYDSSVNQCVIDKDCPRPQFFYQDKQELRNVCESLKRFLRAELLIY